MRFSRKDTFPNRELSQHPGPCNLARSHYQSPQAIARLAMDKNLPPTRFILVRDHMPPFLTLAERALYDDGHVPFVDLFRGRRQRPLRRRRTRFPSLRKRPLERPLRG